MVDNTEGSSDPAQDQTEAAGVASEPNQETIKAILVPTGDGERLQAVQAGGTPKGVTIRISPTAHGLTGITADGAATWQDFSYRRVALKAAVAGEDITSALKTYHDKQVAEEEARKTVDAIKAANRATVEAAGLDWYDTPDEMRTSDDYHAVVMATKEVADQKAKKEAADEQLRADRNAEVAAGLPDGYEPYCTAENAKYDKPYGVTDPTKDYKELLYYRRYDTPAEAITAAHEHADELALKALRKVEREAWITEHGSDGLKDRVARGYNCQHLYMAERLAAELPGWTFQKWDKQPDWELKSRACPTDAALILEDEAKAAGYQAKTYWAVWEADPDHEEYEAEVVVVEDFYGYVIYHET